jgi:hypothetical protein
MIADLPRKAADFCNHLQFRQEKARRPCAIGGRTIAQVFRYASGPGTITSG